MTIHIIVWESDGAALFGTGLSAQGQVVYRLVVERLPSGSGWDWSVWRSGDATKSISDGTALSDANAKADAEKAARAWDTANHP
jgi:hypothetical protein